MEKLVRDKMPEVAKTPMVYRIAEADEEMCHFLSQKLIEESTEVQEAIDLKDREGLIEELADILEIVQAMQNRYGISDEILKTTKFNKFLHRGGFSKGVIWDGNR